MKVRLMDFAEFKDSNCKLKLPGVGVQPSRLQKKAGLIEKETL
jgi:hypothetical protein